MSMLQKVNTTQAWNAVNRLWDHRAISMNEYTDLENIIRQYNEIYDFYEAEMARQHKIADKMTLVDIANDLCRQGRITDLQRVYLLGYIRDAGKFDKVRAVAVLMRLGYVKQVGIRDDVDVAKSLREGYIKDQQEGMIHDA